MRVERTFLYRCARGWGATVGVAGGRWAQGPKMADRF